MLNQLSQLTLQADGRFANGEELSFIRDYISSSKTRISAYKKLRDRRGVIALETEQQILSVDREYFIENEQNFKDKFSRDQDISLRYTSATILSGDLERLKQSILLWTRSIIQSSKPKKCKQLTSVSHQIKADVILEKLDPEECPYVQPILALNQSILGS